MNQLESMVNEAEVILQKLGLPYHVVTLCTGDIGFSARKCYDIEVWLPSYNNYKEISVLLKLLGLPGTSMPISATRIPQSSRVRVSYIPSTVPASPSVRTMAAIIENYQNADGSITVPEALVPYMGGVEVIRPED